jgi:hypothetical protein
MVKKEKGGIFLSGEKKKRMEFLANYLELPKDLLMNLPRITPLGARGIDLFYNLHLGARAYFHLYIRYALKLTQEIVLHLISVCHEAKTARLQTLDSCQVFHTGG